MLSGVRYAPFGMGRALMDAAPPVSAASACNKEKHQFPQDTILSVGWTTGQQSQEQKQQQQQQQQQQMQDKFCFATPQNHQQMFIRSGCQIPRRVSDSTVADRIRVQPFSSSASLLNSTESGVITGTETVGRGGREEREAAGREEGGEGERERGGQVGEVGEDVVIAIGGNIGNRVANFHRALRMLREAGVQVQRHGCLYESAPAYVTDQPFFLNSAIQARTTLSPHALLSLLKSIEASLGRDLNPHTARRFGPRPLDLDLIFYGSRTVRPEGTAPAETTPASSPSTPLDLVVPHPRLAERPFVLAPMIDLVGGCGKGRDLPQGRPAVEDLQGGEGGQEAKEPSWVFHEAFGRMECPAYGEI
ncbi:hypothetical protein CLOM_g15598 [Closterium sp. NIES-68]|nr:hypothetical protein CLOM_g15598 [Closterium sp. NIES-68]